jgi:signal transduction histidine kinase
MVSTATVRPALERPRSMLLGGVSAGVAAHLGWSVQRTRLLFVVLAVLGGSGILLYAWLWALAPLAPATDAAPTVSHSAPVAVVLLSLAGLATIVVLASSTDDRVVTALLAVSVFAGAAVAWSLGFDRTDPQRTRRFGVVIRSAAVGLLMLSGLTTLLSRPAAGNAVLAVGMIVLGVGILVAPFVLQLWTDLMTQRAARVRELQRAEIAAHLHDSVLQTLALIQNRAGASSEVARIARAQERELRDWLFVGDAPVVEDLAAELSGVAAAIELDHAVRIDVVAAGVSVSGHPSLVAATREAMLNAARHAGGTVSVYLETSEDAVDVFVRDRGPGVDLDALPADRMGIRESIIGRMARAGGTATVSRTATGTEVHLHLEVAP